MTASSTVRTRRLDVAICTSVLLVLQYYSSSAYHDVSTYTSTKKYVAKKYKVYVLTVLIVAKN